MLILANKKLHKLIRMPEYALTVMNSLKFRNRNFAKFKNLILIGKVLFKFMHCDHNCVIHRQSHDSFSMNGKIT